MRTIAGEKQWRFFSEVEVSLNPNYTQDQEAFYLLTRREVRSFLGLFERLVHYREIARYSRSEIDNPELLLRILHTAL